MDTPVGEYAVTQAAKAAPTLAVTGLSLGGIPLQEWVYILTIVYTILQIGYFVYGLWKKAKKNGS